MKLSAGADMNGEFTEILSMLIDGHELPAARVRQIFEMMMNGTCGDVEMSAFLSAMRTKGETAGEIAAAAEVLREFMIRWDPECEGVLDTCGTGGDRLGTFNISTATALVIAAVGVPVVKHGNRSVSSNSGSADVLAKLGVQIESRIMPKECLHRTGFAFCFAPCFHPAMKYVAAVRRRLGIPTIFNCIGPLANPAGAPYQLLGVGDARLLDPIAHALLRLNCRSALVVHAADGLDEISLSAPTHFRRIQHGTIASGTWTREDFNLPAVSLSSLQVKSADESARMIRDIFEGKAGPASDVVLANAAAGLVVSEKVDNLMDGVQLAKDAVQSGKALKVLDQLIAVTNENGR